MITRSDTQALTITHYGCADFMITNGSEVIYVDPLPPHSKRFQSYARAFRTGYELIPDLVLSTHQEHDHCEPNAISDLVSLNDEVVVILPPADEDMLKGVIDPKHIRYHLPEFGEPDVISFGEWHIRMYRTLHGWHLAREIIEEPTCGGFHWRRRKCGGL